VKNKMNIHEHQAKEILREFDLPVSKGEIILSISEIKEKISKLKDQEFVLKAQIHAGGRGKAGGVKLVKNLKELEIEAKKMMGKILVTHQTGPEGKTVKRLYIEEASSILKEFYLSCLVDRETSKIAFISSTEGGMDIEKVAAEKPEKIITTKIELNNEISQKDIEKIISPFALNENQKKEAYKLVQGLYKILTEKDATLIEINPLIITKDRNLLCLDAKMNFDDNAIFRRPEILKLRDLNEEEPAEIEASKHDLAYIKLNGSIGCMVNGAGLAMATMDIIKLHGEEPANFLDVGGGATKEKVTAAFKLILADKNVKGILINIFGGIMRCDVLALGVVEAAKQVNLSVPLVVRLAGTNFKEGKEILDKSNLKILSASDLNDAAKKIVGAIK
jgi:succinyl-CoA synthetase beta subunit